MSENDTLKFIADRLKAPPEEIVLTYNNLLVSEPRLDGGKVAEILEPLGIGGPRPVLEEMAAYTESAGSYEDYEDESLALSCSLVLGSLARTGRLGFQEARDMVHENIEEESLHSIFDSELYRYESVAARDRGEYRLGVRLAKKSIDYAYKSGSKNQIFTSKYTEILSLFSGEDYVSSAKKLLMLWKMYERSSSAEDDELQVGHMIKKGILEMWRDSHVNLGNLEEATKVQGILYDLGYKKETAEEWKEWVARIMPG